MSKICVIGAGVIGLSSAVQIAEKYRKNVEVTVITENTSPNTTSDVAAGLWGPWLTGTTPGDKLTQWSKGMFEFQHKLWKDGKADEAGICMIPVFRFITHPEGYEEHHWKDVMFGYRKMDDRLLKLFGKEHGKNYTDGFTAVTFTSEPTKLLPYLHKRFEEAGGKLLRRKVKSFEELEGFDLIVNCTGLGSLELAKDVKMHPIRGQVVRVRAPWIYGVYYDDSDDGNYIIPNYDSIVLGGTHQVNDFSLQVSEKDKQFIQTGCEKVLPGLKHSQYLFDKVGLRPGRTEIQMETEDFHTKSGKKIPIVHCVGHGGCGVTLSWGCGQEVCELVGKALKNDMLKSKL